MTTLSSCWVTPCWHTYSPQTGLVYRVLQTYTNGYALAVAVGDLSEVSDEILDAIDADDRARCTLA